MGKLSIKTVDVLAGFDGKTCKINPKMAYDGKSTYLLNYTMLDLSGSDVFSDSYTVFSGSPTEVNEPTKVFSPFYDEKYKYVYYESVIYYNKFMSRFVSFGVLQRFPRKDVESVKDDLGSFYKNVMRFYDTENKCYDGGYYEIPFPFELSNACPHAQVIENEKGEMLLSFYYSEKGEKKHKVITILYKFEDNELKIVKVGTPVFLDGDKYTRGMLEPSVIKYGNKFYMTIRTDREALWSVSDNRFDFSVPTPHVFDDGTLIESYNTMTRWVKLRDELYLVYTRKNGKNDHVFRNRAPLYITRFDTRRGCLIRSEEQIVAPERGARLGNFSVCDLGDKNIVTVAEWMQTNPPDPSDYTVCQKYGSNNRIWISEITAKK